MRRRLAKLCVFLVLGAVVNVAVAWGCCRIIVRLGDGHTGSVAREADGRGWVYSTWHRPGVSQVIGVVCANAGAGCLDPSDSLRCFGWSAFMEPPPADLDAESLVIDEARGWPMLSLTWSGRARLVTDQDDISADPAGLGRPLQSLSGGIDLGAPPNWVQSGLGVRVIPFAPLWPGFAINTLFYAAVLWLLFAVPFALRRRRRIKRGLCPRCSYPTGASPICTECGAPVKPKTSETAA